MNNKRLLVVAAHPDDEILGCGGTVARFVIEGAEAFVIILGEGVTSRDDVRSRVKRSGELDSLREEIYKANEYIGVKKVFVENFPDNRFDSVPLLDIVKTIEKVKNEVKPDIIFTHYERDLNVDHQITAQAVMTATRPITGETVKELYSFEILSSTEWNYPLSFSPDTYFDITETIQQKVDAMKAYKSELREFPHLRSVKGIEFNGQYWGMRVGVGKAEAFKTLRAIR